MLKSSLPFQFFNFFLVHGDQSGPGAAVSSCKKLKMIKLIVRAGSGHRKPLCSCAESLQCCGMCLVLSSCALHSN